MAFFFFLEKYIGVSARGSWSMALEAAWPGGNGGGRAPSWLKGSFCGWGPILLAPHPRGLCPASSPCCCFTYSSKQSSPSSPPAKAHRFWSGAEEIWKFFFSDLLWIRSKMRELLLTTAHRHMSNIFMGRWWFFKPTAGEGGLRLQIPRAPVASAPWFSKAGRAVSRQAGREVAAHRHTPGLEEWWRAGTSSPWAARRPGFRYLSSLVSCPSGSPHHRRSESRQGWGGAPGPRWCLQSGEESKASSSLLCQTRACLDLMLILGLLSYHLMGVSGEGCRVRPHLSLEGMVLLRTRWAWEPLWPLALPSARAPLEFQKSPRAW